MQDSETKEPRYLSDGYTVEGLELPVSISCFTLTAVFSSFHTVPQHVDRIVDILRSLSAMTLRISVMVCDHCLVFIVRQKKVEVNPAKLAADLESYEDLKRRLVLDTASFGAVGAFVAYEVK